MTSGGQTLHHHCSCIQKLDGDLHLSLDDTGSSHALYQTKYIALRISHFGSICTYGSPSDQRVLVIGIGDPFAIKCLQSNMKPWTQNYALEHDFLQ